MKKSLVISAVAVLGLTSVAFAGGIPEEMPAAPSAASEQGVYVGISGGYGMTNWKNVENNYFNNHAVSKVDKDNGFVGRAFLGYDIDKHFAIEAGYSYFFNKAKLTSTKTVEVKAQSIDLFGKVKGPVTDEFNLYAKVGAAYIMSKIVDGDSHNHIGPAFGVGAEYSVTSNIIVSAEWLRNIGSPKIDKDYQPSTDAFLAGVRYRFDI
jgi:OmpA-OmpF porin, OOP family